MTRPSPAEAGPGKIVGTIAESSLPLLPDNVAAVITASAPDELGAERLSYRAARLLEAGQSEHEIVHHVKKMAGNIDMIADDGGLVDVAEPFGAFLDPDRPADDSAWHLYGWEPVDLGGLADGEVPTPSLLTHADGVGLFYPAKINEIHGPSGDGKGWVAVEAVRQELLADRTVAIVDYEDSAMSWAMRLSQVGLSAERLTGVDYYAATERVPAELTPQLRRHSLVVIDSVGEAMAAAGKNGMDDIDVANWFRTVPRAIANAGPAVLLIDHTTKAGDNDLWSSGSQRKRAAINGAAYALRAKTPFVKGRGGRVGLICAKDRNGAHRSGESVAELVMTDSGRLGLYPSDGGSHADATTALIVGRAMDVLEQRGPLSQAGLEQAIREGGVKARATAIRGALDLGVADGHLRVTNGARNSKLFTLSDPVPTLSDEVA